MVTLEELNEMRQADIRTVDVSQLTDLRDVEINEKDNVKKRVAQYMEAVKNPFLMKIGSYAVKVSYSESGEGIEERMLAYISDMVK
jgi:hypothetical protein